MNFFVILYFIV